MEEGELGVFACGGHSGGEECGVLAGPGMCDFFSLLGVEHGFLFSGFEVLLLKGMERGLG